MAMLSWVSVDHASPLQTDWGLRVQALESPAPANSAQPQLSVSARGVLLSWIERDAARATLKFSELSPAGWSTPALVASGDTWFVNWADVPSVIRLPDGTLAAHWLQKSGPGTYAYDVRLSHSKDDGRTWAPSFLPHADQTPAEHGFASLFPAAGGGMGLIWLDGRAMHATDHATGAGGAMALRVGAFDRNWKQTSEAPIDLRVCDCCPTAAAVTTDGPIVAFRDRTDQEIRDIVVSRLENGKWTVPVAVARDNWHITGCPVNGPSCPRAAGRWRSPGSPEQTPRIARSSRFPAMPAARSARRFGSTTVPRSVALTSSSSTMDRPSDPGLSTPGGRHNCGCVGCRRQASDPAPSTSPPWAPTDPAAFRAWRGKAGSSCWRGPKTRPRPRPAAVLSFAFGRRWPRFLLHGAESGRRRAFLTQLTFLVA